MPTRSRPEVFVGRAAELGRLTALAEQAAGGTGAVVLLAGEAGAGKTTLVEQLGRQTALPVHWASCWEDEGQPPYWAWTQLLRALPDPVRPGSPLAVLLPEVGSAPATDRFTVHDAAVDALAAAGPAVLVVDDLHWADPSSVALLLHLARRVRRLPLLVLATYRDTDVRPGSALDGALGPMARLAEVVAVPGLSPEEVAELLATVAGAVPAGLAAQVHLESDGNALFATELARLVAQRGQAREVPAALGPVVVERLTRFAPATLEALEVAAVLGLRSAPHELAEVLQVPAEQLLARLEEPTRGRVLRPGPDVVFTHALVRAVLLQRMAPAVRAGWHARCVEVLAAVPDRER
ncbi:MAG: hypothetical protein JWN55_3001, partial [Frankiales bacterium]|nr:hypothetical protein [Frankiales bacterium]